MCRHCFYCMITFHRVGPPRACLCFHNDGGGEMKIKWFLLSSASAGSQPDMTCRPPPSVSGEYFCFGVFFLQVVSHCREGSLARPLDGGGGGSPPSPVGLLHCLAALDHPTSGPGVKINCIEHSVSVLGISDFLCFNIRSSVRLV